MNQLASSVKEKLFIEAIVETNKAKIKEWKRKKETEWQSFPFPMFDVAIYQQPQKKRQKKKQEKKPPTKMLSKAFQCIETPMEVTTQHKHISIWYLNWQMVEIFHFHFSDVLPYGSFFLRSHFIGDWHCDGVLQKQMRLIEESCYQARFFSYWTTRTWKRNRGENGFWLSKRKTAKERKSVKYSVLLLVTSYAYQSSLRFIISDKK